MTGVDVAILNNIATMSDYMSNAIESPNHTDEETGDAATFLAILKCATVI